MPIPRYKLVLFAVAVHGQMDGNEVVYEEVKTFSQKKKSGNASIYAVEMIPFTETIPIIKTD